MREISNEDYGKVKRLLTNLTTCNPKDWRWREAKRLALLLLRKWDRAEKRRREAIQKKDDKLYIANLVSGENARNGAEIVGLAMHSGWHPTEKAQEGWDMVVEDARTFLENKILIDED